MTEVSEIHCHAHEARPKGSARQGTGHRELWCAICRLWPVKVATRSSWARQHRIHYNSKRAYDILVLHSRGDEFGSQHQT